MVKGSHARWSGLLKAFVVEESGTDSLFLLRIKLKAQACMDLKGSTSSCKEVIISPKFVS